MTFPSYRDDFERALIGSQYTAVTNEADLAIVSGRVRGSSLAGNGNHAYVNTFPVSTNQFGQLTLAGQSGAVTRSIGPSLRVQAGAESYYGMAAYIDHVSVATEISLLNAGAFTQLIAENTTIWVAGDKLIFTARGPNLNTFRNGSLLLSASDATLTSGLFGLNIYVDTLGSLGDMEGDDYFAGTLPIAFVAAGTEGEAASGNVTPGIPAGIIENDILICCCHSSDQVAHSMTSDWTQIVQGNGGGTTSRLSVWWHRYNGKTAPSALITHTSGSGIIAGISAFRGCKKGGNPYNVAGTIATGTDASIEHNSITPTMDYCLLLIINGAADDNNRTLIVGTENIFEDTGAGVNNAFVGTLGTTDESISMFMRDVMAAATGTITVTQAAADPWASVLIALEPDLSGAPFKTVQQAVSRSLVY